MNKEDIEKYINSAIEEKTFLEWHDWEQKKLAERKMTYAEYVEQKLLILKATRLKR